MSMRVEIRDRQPFHMREQIIADIAQRSLSDIDQDAVIGKCGEHAGHEHTQHDQQDLQQRAEVRRIRLCQRRDIVIDQHLDEQRYRHAGQRGQDDEDQREQTGDLVMTDDIAQQTAEHLEIHMFPTHRHQPPSSVFHTLPDRSRCSSAIHHACRCRRSCRRS